MSPTAAAKGIPEGKTAGSVVLPGCMALCSRVNLMLHITDARAAPERLTSTHEHDPGPQRRVARSQSDVYSVWTCMFQTRAGQNSQDAIHGRYIVASTYNSSKRFCVPNEGIAVILTCHSVPDRRHVVRAICECREENAEDVVRQQTFAKCALHQHVTVALRSLLPTSRPPREVTSFACNVRPSKQIRRLRGQFAVSNFRQEGSHAM